MKGYRMPPDKFATAQAEGRVHGDFSMHVHNQERAAKKKPAHVPGVMNKTEAKFAWMLEARKINNEIKGWKFEPTRFVLAHKTTYQPDFVVYHLDNSIEFVEIKGPQIWEKNRIKFKVAREMFPQYVWTLMQLKNGVWKELSVKK